MKKKKTSRSPARRTPGKRNKKLQAEGFRMPATLSLLGVLLFAIALFFVLFSSRTEALARQIKIEEQALEDLKRKVAGEEVRWNGLIGPRNLSLALKNHGLEMNWPRPNQVVHIRDMALWESNAGELNVLSRVDRDERGYRLQ
ncbi:MAG: hypothetical protein ACO3N7_06260 [Kiritimatiellia bacterium]